MAAEEQAEIVGSARDVFQTECVLNVAAVVTSVCDSRRQHGGWTGVRARWGRGYPYHGFLGPYAWRRGGWGRSHQPGWRLQDWTSRLDHSKVWQGGLVNVDLLTYKGLSAISPFHVMCAVTNPAGELVPSACIRWHNYVKQVKISSISEQNNMVPHGSPEDRMKGWLCMILP